MIPDGCMTVGIDAVNIMVCGGYQDKKFLTQTWVFNLKTEKITPTKDMIQNREAFGIAYDDLEEEIYVIGGQGNNFNYLSHCERYTKETDEWIEMRPLNKAKANASVCIINNQYIYVIAGINDSSSLSDIERYSIETNAAW